MALEDHRRVVRWLLAPENERELEVLEALAEEDSRAPALQKELSLDHPQKIYRSLSYLQDRGLVSQFRDLSGERAGDIYEISPIGRRVLGAVRDIQDLLSERQDKAGREIVQSTRSGIRIRVRRKEQGTRRTLPVSLGNTVRLRRGAEVSTEIGSFSEGSSDDKVVVRA